MKKNKIYLDMLEKGVKSHFKHYTEEYLEKPSAALCMTLGSIKMKQTVYPVEDMISMDILALEMDKGHYITRAWITPDGRAMVSSTLLYNKDTNKGILHGHGATLINDPTITHVLDDPLKHFLELALDKELEYLNPYLDE